MWGSPSTGPPSGTLGDPELSKPGERGWLWEASELMGMEQKLSCPSAWCWPALCLYLDWEPERRSLQWASALFGSSQYQGKLRASELCSEIFSESQEELGAAVYLLYPLLTKEVCFLSHLQLKEKEQLWCTGSSDMSGSALSGLHSNFVRWNVHVSQIRTPAIRPLGNLLEDREVKQ